VVEYFYCLVFSLGGACEVFVLAGIFRDPRSVHFLERPRKRTKRSRPVSRFSLRFSKGADSVKLASLKQSQNLIAPPCDAQRVTMGFKKTQVRISALIHNPAFLFFSLAFSEFSVVKLFVGAAGRREYRRWENM
jgi:hypothetical protein